MREYVAHHEPDLAFNHRMKIFDRRSSSAKWRQSSDLTGQKIRHHGREYSCLVSANEDKRKAESASQQIGTCPNWRENWDFVPRPYPWDASINATVTWDRWDTAGANRLAVFHYRVSQKDSRWLLIDYPDWEHLTSMEQISGRATVPYFGEISIDPTTGSIWRCSDTVNEFPPGSKASYAYGVTQYGPFAIGGVQYLLPVTRDEETRFKVGTTRVESSFWNYRKFEAESAITFFGADSTITYRH